MSSFWSQVFDYPTWSSAMIIAGKTAAVYFALVLGLRLLGKRELGQMNLYDLVLIVVLGNSVQNAMINSDNTLVGGLVAAGTLLILNRLLNGAFGRFKKLESAMVGQPTLIVSDGMMVAYRMDREGITRDQLMAALREHGLESLDEVRFAILEVDGTISVIPAGASVPRTRRHYRGLRL